jgi:hypothetical protein
MKSRHINLRKKKASHVLVAKCANVGMKAIPDSKPIEMYIRYADHVFIAKHVNAMINSDKASGREGGSSPPTERNLMKSLPINL